MFITTISLYYDPVSRIQLNNNNKTILSVGVKLHNKTNPLVEIFLTVFIVLYTSIHSETFVKIKNQPLLSASKS